MVLRRRRVSRWNENGRISSVGFRRLCGVVATRRCFRIDVFARSSLWVWTNCLRLWTNSLRSAAYFLSWRSFSTEPPCFFSLSFNIGVERISVVFALFRFHCRVSILLARHIILNLLPTVVLFGDLERPYDGLITSETYDQVSS